MATYFVGGELDSVVITAASGVTESTAAGSQSGFSRGAIRLDSSVRQLGFSCYLINPTTGVRQGATGVVWFHFNCWVGNVNSTTEKNFTWCNSTGTQVFRLQMAGNQLWQPQLWSGSAWVNVGPSLNYQGQVFNNTYDIQFNMSAGSFKMFINNVEMTSVAVDLTPMGNIARMDVTSNGSDLYIAQIIAADYNTIGHTVRRRTPSGNGVNTAWTGTWDGVDEFGLNDGDGISTLASGTKETFTANTLPVTESGKVIKAVALAVRARVDESAVPRKVKGLLRIGTTDYESPAIQGADGYTYGGGVVIFEKDPSTNADWASVTNINGEFGVKSDT